VLISSTFYACVFHTKDNCATFSTYVLALAKGFGRKKALVYEKRAHKMLMKLTIATKITLYDLEISIRIRCNNFA